MTWKRTIICSVVLLIALAGALFFFNQDVAVKQELTKRELFLRDSLHFERLVRTGDSIYAIRDEMNNISKSLIYFDSAVSLAKQINNDKLSARSHFYIGNVYNAWNLKPERTIYHYNKALQLIKDHPESKLSYYTYSNILAHAYDFEKFGDSAKCVAILNKVFQRLKTETDSAKRAIDVLPDFAWIASNVHNYQLAEAFISDHLQFPLKNNPSTNNYLDHYYITKARIDILGRKAKYSPYLDSIELSAKHCSNNFDKQYYLFSLIELNLKTGNFKKAFEVREITIRMDETINKSEITTLLRNNKLLKKLNVSNLKREEVSSDLREAHLYITASLIALLLLIIVFGIVYFQRKRKHIEKESTMRSQFTKQLFETIESNQQRIASDLHDSIGNELITLKRSANPDQVALKAKIDQLMETIRTISRNLHPVMFERIGLKITLDQLVERIQYADHFMLTAEIDYQKGLSPTTELQVYRIVQEAITNIIKHADAIAGKISIEEKQQVVLITIKDNGKGFNVEQTMESSKAFGIHNIVERVQAISGSIAIKSGSAGTHISIEIPKPSL